MANHLNLLSYHKTFHLTFSTHTANGNLFSLSSALVKLLAVFMLCLLSTVEIGWTKRRWNKLRILKKIEIDKMDFSKRKNGIFKKAHKLTLLCDAEVSIIILSSNNELMYEYTSPTSTYVLTYKIFFFFSWCWSMCLFSSSLFYWRKEMILTWSVSLFSFVIFFFFMGFGRMKKMIDQYQSRVGVDLWSSHYEV